MKFKLGFASALVLVSSLASMASVHTFLRTLTINGKQSGVKDSASNDMTCSIPGSSKDADLCPVKAENMIIEESHQGLCFVFMAPLESNGKGDV
ncbi:hypothetical protein BX661DRAFT_201441 [Kickxella alabastrina]|uniref:uncharacterized protein n=1 Tax=Kickxella alabastrina TaxID=61397 RepID=UPI0022211293|nr:uncharacterized protein BX661DRAFT_201441 [Kickxella alabastrina]KAI7819364.1 hypothetical protein BX661DRAFT_201441 [Kickxella alabastrina]